MTHRPPLIIDFIDRHRHEFTPFDAAKRILLIVAAGFVLAVLSAVLSAWAAALVGSQALGACT